MKSPSEELIEVILPLLERSRLLLPEDLLQYKEKIATGTIKPEDWLLMVEKAAQKGVGQ
jgi:hypothetical protein